MPEDPSFFPSAVWLQAPRNAERFKAAGINLYVGLWDGPTEDQLRELEKAGMPVICDPNEVGLRNRENPIIVGWMHGDEPDNAQALPDGKGYGPPIPPKVIVDKFQTIRSADATRPVLLNFGPGFAWDTWVGRGVRTNHPEDYPEYLKGCDIASFDIYPVVETHADVAGKLEFVGNGVKRLVGLLDEKQTAWNCIECTHINNANTKATPDQVRSEVWMSLINGSRGIIYFVHQFSPDFKEAALLDDPEMLAAVTAINQQIKSLAPVLNSPTVEGLLKVETLEETPIASMLKQSGDSHYVFAVNMRNLSAEGKFALLGIRPGTRVDVVGEDRQIPLGNGVFGDAFKPYEVHIYRMEGAKAP